MFFKRLLVACVSASLVYSPVAMAQSQSGIPAGWRAVSGANGVISYISPVNFSSLSRSSGQYIWDAAVASSRGAATFTARTSLSLAVSDAVIVTRAAVTAPGLFAVADRKSVV